ncbi:MAG: hypothetical protein HY248_03090 [Fimbriimonas ginsengisoli]|uniref:DUF3261 domain-containing protein n=1 Tax=Fimbriimonas ginsengisoli TaxID=1005039 RepID=A0A931LVD6_FIMGI|nr:hypothetical protein [Fimbriimonas ginsengisoli]MBI3721514.1 hypothetical protein [Fimbriimonas ginsengisoli]
MKLAALGIAALALGGCGAQGTWMPLELGHTATYQVRTGFVSYVEPIRVAHVLSVAGVRGAELNGPMGPTRLAWKGGELVAASMANAHVDPPIPLLTPDDLALTRQWKGTLTFAGVRENATAVLAQRRAGLVLGGRNYRTVRATLTLDTPARQVQLVSDYAQGIGLVRQEQRTNGRFDLALELLAGSSREL